MLTQQLDVFIHESLFIPDEGSDVVISATSGSPDAVGNGAADLGDVIQPPPVPASTALSNKTMLERSDVL